MGIIASSVGMNGRNVAGDVAMVQQLLGLRRLMFSEPIPETDEGGMCGQKTISAIAAFQERIVRLPRPDGRIDPLGRTLRTLVYGFTPPELHDLVVARRWLGSTAKRNPPVPRASALAVQYTDVPNVLPRPTAYTEEVVRGAMALAGVTSVKISSTLRTIQDQARIMYTNCSGYPNAENVNQLRSMRGWGYSAPGQAVEAIFFKMGGPNNKDQDKKMAIRAAMEAKIYEFAGQGVRVSLHCVPAEAYALRNIIDIPYSSVVDKKAEFQAALVSMSAKVKPHSAQNFHSQGIIDLLIIEDKCWHVEIPQCRTTLPVVVQTS